MPVAPLSLRNLFEIYQHRLALHWLAGHAGAVRSLHSAEESEAPLVGYLNLIHPARLQILGAAELDYLSSLDEKTYNEALGNLFTHPTLAVFIAGGLHPPVSLRRAADQHNTALIGSALASDKLLNHLDYYLNDLLADKQVVHGVFMDVMGIGVLLTGESSVGKSELALELISRGHALIADDAPEFYRVGPDSLRGSCPELLQDFLEVRGLGLLDIRAMLGDSAVKRHKILRLIVNLIHVDKSDINSIDRLQGSYSNRTLSEVNVPEIQLPVAPGRNLAVLVEAAARNHILRENGYDATGHFIARQHRLMMQEEQEKNSNE
ncbi:MAG: HPr(Ser) kinase/phosphatase [Thiohalomonadaceae bacterium]